MCFLIVGSHIFLVITSKLPEQELKCFSLTGRSTTPTNESEEEELLLQMRGYWGKGRVEDREE